MSFDFSGVVTALKGLLTAVKQPVIDIGIAAVSVIAVIVFIKYGVAWIKKLGSR